MNSWLTGCVASVGARLCFGRVHIFVTNSGSPPSNLFKSTAPQAWRAVADQLLRSTIRLVTNTSPRIQRDFCGRLISINSSAINRPVLGGLARRLYPSLTAVIGHL